MKHTILIVALAAFVAGAGIAQDECGTAIAVSDGINPSPPLGVSGTTYTNVGMTTSVGSPVPCGSAPNDDIWFVYTALVAGSHTFSTDTPAGFAIGTHTDTTLQVLDAASGCPPLVALGCDDDGGVSPSFSSTLAVTLAAAGIYYVRISTWDAATADGTFYLTVTPPPPPAPNDECATATALSLGVNPTPVASGNRFSNAGATLSAGWPALATCPTAAATINLDVWFGFTPVATDTYSFSTENPCGFTAGSMTNTSIALYDGSVVSCAVPAAHMICDGDSGVGSLSLLSAVLTAGTTYFLRVGPTGTTGTANVNATFYVTVTQGPLPGTVNDECAGAVVLGLGTNPAPAISCNLYSNDGATTSAGWPALSTCPTATAAITNDVWFSFTPGVSDTYFFDTNNPCGFTAGTMTNTTIALYDGSVVSCAVPAAHMICDGDSGVGSLSALSAALTAGTTYFLRVGASATTGNGTFYVNIAQGSTAVPNDECASPLSVALGINPAPGVSCFTYDNTFATTSAGWPTPCATTINDLWFSFVPTTTGNYVLSTDTPAGFAAGTNTDTVLSVHDATCVVGPAIGCDDDSGVSPALNSQLTITLIGGTPYMIRIGSFSATTTGSFYLTISRVFSLTFTSPLGPGSIQADIAAGPSLGTYFMCVTFNPVGFPTGYFFGITPSIQEIVSQAAGFPFVGPLNATGDFVLGPVGGLPSGVLTLYAVALGFDTAVLDVPTVVSTPESYLVP